MREKYMSLVNKEIIIIIIIIYFKYVPLACIVTQSFCRCTFTKLLMAVVYLWRLL